MTTDTEKPDGGSSELTAWNPLEALILPAVRSWGLIAITTVLGAIIGTFLALVKPNEYESHAKIHVRPSLASSANPELAMAEGGDGPTAKPDIANHFHLLTSEEVFLRVAEDLGPMTILQPYHPAEDDNDGTPFLTRKLHEFQSWWFGAYEFEAAKNDQAAYTSNRMIRAAVEVLKGSTSVGTDGVSNIIDVHYRTHDPALAQTILRSVIEKHEERHLLISSVKPVTDFFRKQQEKYQEEWEAATSELNAFRDQHQISDLSTQIADLFSEKERLERELNFGDNRLLEYREKKLEALQQEFASTSEQVMTEARKEMVPNPEYVLKYNELLDQRKELLQLLDTFKTGPEVTAQRARVSALETELSEIEPEREVDVPPQKVRNPDYEPLKDRIETLEETIEENQLSIDTKKSRLEEVTARLGALREQQTEFDSLRRRVERAEYLKSNFERASQQFSVTRMLQEQSESNLSVWTEPTIPFRKSGPQRAKLVIASLGGGIFAGFGLALVRSVMDRTVRRRKELETLLGVPCIGVVQAKGKWPWRQARKASRKFPVEEVR